MESYTPDDLLTNQNDWIGERFYDVNHRDYGTRGLPDVRQWQAGSEYINYSDKINQSLGDYMVS